MFWLFLHGRMFVMGMYTLEVSVHTMNVNPHKLAVLGLCVRMSSKQKKQWLSAYDQFVSYGPDYIVRSSVCVFRPNWPRFKPSFHKDTFHACVHTCSQVDRFLQILRRKDVVPAFTLVL